MASRGRRAGPRPAAGAIYTSEDGRHRLYARDGRDLSPIATGSVGVIFTSPPYWQTGRGLAAADRYARRLAERFSPEWRRVLSPGGDLWIVIGDRHDGREWVGIDGLVTSWLRRARFGLQAKGCWAQMRSREPWYDRINHVLRFRKARRRARPTSTTLAWMLPLPRSHRDSQWDATPDPIIRTAIAESARRGAVLDPFAGAGTVGLVAAAMGRSWIGVERDPGMAALAARRLGLRPMTGSGARPASV
jgi:DNA modification methylase